jgi:hypothetical protein
MSLNMSQDENYSSLAKVMIKTVKIIYYFWGRLTINKKSSMHECSSEQYYSKTNDRQSKKCSLKM